MDDDVQVQARALGSPTRHAVFRYLVDADRPVGVAELTEQFGFNHNAIRQHLAKLVDAGLVTEAQAPPSGRGRPRPSPRPINAVNMRAKGRSANTNEKPNERFATLPL